MAIFDVSAPEAEMLAPMIAAKVGSAVSPGGIQLGEPEVLVGHRNTAVTCAFRDGTGRPPRRLKYHRYELPRLFPQAVRHVRVAQIEIQEILYRFMETFSIRFSADDFVIHSVVDNGEFKDVTLRPVEGSLKFVGEITFQCEIFIPD